MKTLEIESNVAEGRPTLQKILAERRKSAMKRKETTNKGSMTREKP